MFVKPRCKLKRKFKILVHNGGLMEHNSRIIGRNLEHSSKFNAQYIIIEAYCKQEKIYWAKLLQFSWFSRVPQKFFHEYTHLSLIIYTKQ